MILGIVLIFETIHVNLWINHTWCKIRSLKFWLYNLRLQFAGVHLPTLVPSASEDAINLIKVGNICRNYGSFLWFFFSFLFFPLQASTIFLKKKCWIRKLFLMPFLYLSFHTVPFSLLNLVALLLGSLHQAFSCRCSTTSFLSGSLFCFFIVWNRISMHVLFMLVICTIVVSITKFVGL